MEASKVKIVYVVSERSGKHFWNRIGIAFLNRDGSINVKLDAVPIPASARTPMTPAAALNAHGAQAGLGAVGERRDRSVRPLAGAESVPPPSRSSAVDERADVGAGPGGS